MTDAGTRKTEKEHGAFDFPQGRELVEDSCGDRPTQRDAASVMVGPRGLEPRTSPLSGARLPWGDRRRSIPGRHTAGRVARGQGGAE